MFDFMVFHFTSFSAYWVQWTASSDIIQVLGINKKRNKRELRTFVLQFQFLAFYPLSAIWLEVLVQKLHSLPSPIFLAWSSEISRPENKGLAAALNLIEEAKKEIDSNSKGGPISYADLIQLAGCAS